MASKGFLSAKQPTDKDPCEFTRMWVSSSAEDRMLLIDMADSETVQALMALKKGMTLMNVPIPRPPKTKAQSDRNRVLELQAVNKKC